MAKLYRLLPVSGNPKLPKESETSSRQEHYCFRTEQTQNPGEISGPSERRAIPGTRTKFETNSNDRKQEITETKAVSNFPRFEP